MVCPKSHEVTLFHHSLHLNCMSLLLTYACDDNATSNQGTTDTKAKETKALSPPFTPGQSHLSDKESHSHLHLLDSSNRRALRTISVTPAYYSQHEGNHNQPQTSPRA